MEQTASIVQSLKATRTYDVFRALEQSQPAATSLPYSTVLTVYVETDTGYPVTVSAPLAEDHVALMKSYLLSLVLDMGPGGAVHDQLVRDGKMSEASSSARESAALRSAADDLTRRLVVLGVEQPYADYDPTRGVAHGVFATEVLASRGSRPFLATPLNWGNSTLGDVG